ncbi:hypothetical protein GPK87_18190 [Oscillibacter sp. MCC667]|nr:hypothetical protein [Oscillibacter sp. MCC667]
MSATALLKRRTVVTSKSSKLNRSTFFYAVHLSRRISLPASRAG